MTTENIIATLRQGVPVTSRLVREIVVKPERLDWTERSFSAALEKYGTDAGVVKLSAEETSWVCDGLDAHNALKEAVAWMVECESCGNWMDRRGWFQDEMAEIYAAAKNAVEEPL